MKYTSVVFCFR